MQFNKQSLPTLLLALLLTIITLPLIADTNAEQPQPPSNCARCGDGYCAPSCENERTCPADCKSTKVAAEKPAAPSNCAKCGDGYCAPSCENERTCPADCRSTKTETAANVKCEEPKKE